METTAADLGHVHTDTCWQESLPCAIAKIHELQAEKHGLLALIAKLQLDLRVIGGSLDRIEARLQRLLNPRPKS